MNRLRKINAFIQRLPEPLRRYHLERPANNWLINPAVSKNIDSVVEGYHFGQRVLDLLAAHAELDFTETILDAGCGDGRVASALARNGFRGRYYGFEIHRERIAALKKLFVSKPEYSFFYANIIHSYYNPGGRVEADEFVYPYPDDIMDLVFYNSIFSHMKIKTIRRNLEEAGRVIKPEGKIWASFFCLDEHHNPKYDRIKWHFTWTYDQGYTAAPENPEKVVGFDRIVLDRLFESCGLIVAKYIPGTWKLPRTSLDQHIQDVFILQPAA